MKKTLYILSLIIAVALMVMGVLGVFGCTAQAQTPGHEQAAQRDTVTATANIGKAISPRMLFTEFDTEATQGGGGGNPLKHSPGGYGAEQFVYTALAIIVAVAVIGFAGYGIYVAITGKT